MLKDLEIEAFIAQKSSFDLLIDARSPKEFNESHIPSASNYYALNDAEHHEVGTVYKQVSHNDAKLLGAHYICLNAARHLMEIGRAYKIGSKIGIYCAKGGLRSSSLAIILSHIGYQVFRLQGGYKRYRYHVLNYLEHLPHNRFIVLGGNTGCGKSELLQKLSSSLDLESLANHLGSSFGSIKGIQPSQKSFENHLYERLRALPPESYIFVEAESKKMGRCTIPSLLYQRIHQGFRVEVFAPLEQRIQRILNDYQTMSPEFFYHAMYKITPYIQKNIKEAILEAYEHHDLEKVVAMLLVEYYDRVYKKPQHNDMSLENNEEKSALETLKSLHVKLSSLSDSKM
ncbi:tRNA 2-selenouridine(34) synthase MnmH [Sulfurospirillum deleyianum]|uniref:tRNA 2-selenouridine synthase n=1 Tax=Sulfurospirillum deleyianum (strain ATCC 51133 / DSM 6946 / 5175) TaxID=525898 RepID=D1B2K4_SULD5|nr:tRNA 2-selenouridine(34) synthase MnmH [Sulfurospirillum deleyianum]ACZ12324.1 tRNA 2-selenouridine synthase [Sulfurospirillum deleyianum DSM 6946]